jgi:hypothetical protein
MEPSRSLHPLEIVISTGAFALAKAQWRDLQPPPVPVKLYWVSNRHRQSYPISYLFGFGGTFAPFLRASDRPMAIACFGLVTFLPLRPLFSLP